MNSKHTRLQGQYFWSFVQAIAFAGCFMLSAVNAFAAETADWSAPNIDIWSYDHAGSPGFSKLNPTFTGGFEIDPQTNQFFEHGSSGTARLSTFITAFETTNEIDAGLAASRYDIQSVTLTFQMYLSPLGTPPIFETAVPTPAEFLADFAGPGLDSQQPIELFGVGFRDNYEGFALGPNQTGTRMSEVTAPFSAGDGGYIAYPVVGDPQSQGDYIDVMNNITGGFSATGAGDHTDPFAATPWAVGQGFDSGGTPLTVGGPIPNRSTFSFELNLALPGVEQYVQESLADGVIGFVLSSLHSTEVGGGIGTYPSWASKEQLSKPDAIAPSLSIEYTILPEGLEGDYDEDGDVDGSDFLMWQTTFNDTVPAGSGADGNGNGTVDADDFTIWSEHFGETTPAGLGAATGVPEPSSALLLVVILIALFFTASLGQRPSSQR